MIDSLNQQKIPLIYVSKTVIEDKKREYWNRAAGYYAEAAFGSAVVSSAILYVGYISYTMWPIIQNMIVPYMLMTSSFLIYLSYGVYLTHLAVKAGRAEYAKYLNYDSYIKTESVDLSKLCEEEVLEISAGSLIELSENNKNDAEKYKNLYLEKILRSYFLPAQVSMTSLAGKKPYLNIFPYTHEYLEKQKKHFEQQRNAEYGKILQEWGLIILSSACVWLILENPLSLVFATLTAIVVLVKIYDQYKQDNFYSKLASNVDLSNGEEKLKEMLRGRSPDIIGLEEMLGTRSSDIIQKASYDKQNLFNLLLDRLCAENNDARNKAIDSFVELVNKSKQRQILIN